MKYGSVCSGIEAASVAWEPLGWKPQFFAEIEPFPSAVLAERWPEVPNLGDFTTIGDEHDIDLLVGGTPCQSFSVAGLRKGMADARGNLALEYIRLADRLRPRWIVWENVPGVLSSNGGRDFGSFLGALEELGYGFAYRVLDAQYIRVDGYARAVPQRRRRVFVVGYLGDWRRAAAVLFERESVFGNPPPRREAGQGFTACIAPSLTASGRGVERTGDTRGQDPVVAIMSHDVTPALVSNGDGHTGFRDEPVLVAFDTTQITSATNRSQPKAGDPCHPLAAGAHPPAIAFGFDPGQSNNPKTTMQITEGGSPPLPAGSGAAGRIAVASQMAVRRLTPRECERLQGFPDDYTLITMRNKPAADGPRYKALGNSMAVNVMRWIGKRIQLINTFPSYDEAFWGDLLK